MTRQLLAAPGDLPASLGAQPHIGGRYLALHLLPVVHLGEIEGNDQDTNNFLSDEKD